MPTGTGNPDAYKLLLIFAGLDILALILLFFCTGRRSKDE